MARYGKWNPLASNWASQPRMKQYDILCLHTMVGSLWGTDGYFRKDGYGGAESHWGVGYDGEVLQWQDTDFQADANYQGGWHILSVETADFGVGFPSWNTNDGGAVPAWTNAQVEALAQLAAWCNRVHGIPLVLIPDSKVGRRGIGFHRQGVPGYMVSGGEQWSTAPGKVCPGDRRIAQIPGIIARAIQIVSGPADLPIKHGSDDAMFIIHKNNKKTPDGPGPFGANQLGYSSGGVFIGMDPGPNKADIEHAVLTRNVPCAWVDWPTWLALDLQSKQLRGVEGDGVTQGFPDPPA